MHVNTNHEFKKVCTLCKNEFPANGDYFGKEAKGKYGLRSRCRTCMHEITISKREEKKAYDLQYNSKNKERIRKRQKEYTKEHKEEKREYDKQRREEKRDEILRKKKEYYAKVKDRFGSKWLEYRQKTRESKRLYDFSYYRANKERKRAVCADWRKRNITKDRILKQNYKARKEKLQSNYSVKNWEECINYFNGCCAYCGKRKKLAQEHFIPVSKGGEYTRNNIVPACTSCNTSKLNKDFIEWYPKMTFFSEKRLKSIYEYLGYCNKRQQQLALF